MKTTLNQIRRQLPCADVWKKLLDTLGKTKADDEEVSIIQVLDSNGLDDAIWTLRAVTGRDKEIQLFAVWCAREVQHLMTDQHSINALDVAEKFANGEATKVELAAAKAAAKASASAAKDAASAAAKAAWEGVWATWDPAKAAARSAARAAKAAALAAAFDANVAVDASRVAWDAMRDAQEAELRRICAE